MGFSQFWDDFTGKSSQKDLSKANAAAEAALAAGREQADTKFGQAYDLFEPYAAYGKQGMDDTQSYRHAIGLGTDEQRAAMQGRYFSDPAFQRITENSQNAMMRGLNARGLSGSGVAAEVGSRVAYGGYTDWLNRLRGSGENAMSVGLQSRGAQAGIRGQQADLAYGHGATRAGNAINYGNAMAGTRGILTNNLLGLAGVGAQAAKAMVTGGA